MNKAKGRRSTKNRPRYERYINEGRRVKNKIKRLIKHLKTHPKDRRTQSALEGLKA